MHWKLLVFAWLLTIAVPYDTNAAEPSSPEITLANIYVKGVDVSQYWVSEKLDGVRAYWDGQDLLSRQGNIYTAPSWFTQGFPSEPLDGELWMGRNNFEKLVGTVRSHTADEAAWRHVRYMVFDLPISGNIFTHRLAELRRLSKGVDNQYIQIVEHFRIKDHHVLMSKLDEVVNAGGEGLMLHRADSLYRQGRTGDLLKLKTSLDAEARVLAHLPGRGKFRGMLGALRVEMPDGKRFRLGTGFSNEERKRPPPVGSFVTYKYYGKTHNGIPRFASFLRIRDCF